MSLKAQSSLEFVVIVMGLLFIFVGMAVFIQERMAISRYESTSVAVREVALIVQEEINSAESAANGYSRQFVLPQMINGGEYEANILEGDVYVRTNDEKHAIALPVGNVTGDLVIGVNSIIKTNNTVMLNS